MIQWNLISEFGIGHPITMNTLSYAINFWSKGEMKALFLRHEGHLGATGAVSLCSHIRVNANTQFELLSVVFKTYS